MTYAQRKHFGKGGAVAKKRGRKPDLDKLRAEQVELNRKIKEAEEAEKREIEEREAARFQLVGRTVCAAMENGDAEFSEWVNDLLTNNVRKAAERKLLGLEPLPRKKRSDGSSENSEAGQ